MALEQFQIPPDPTWPWHNPPTTRDQWRYHFAGLAMQGMLANPYTAEMLANKASDDGTMNELQSMYARMARIAAETLIAELEKAK